MTYCLSCGAENADGTQFCIRCGASIAPAPAPESWKASGDPGNQSPGSNPGGGYAPGPAPAPGAYNQPQANYPAYNPAQTPMGIQPIGGVQPMHPAIPAIVSLMMPGIGLLFVKDKTNIALIMFGAYVVYWIIAFVLTFFVVGICLYLLLPIFHIGAGIYTWDEAAKQSNGQFAPVLFKN